MNPGPNHQPETKPMNPISRLFLILTALTLPGALWVGGDWWKWLITAVVLFVLAAALDQDGTEGTR